MIRFAQDEDWQSAYEIYRYYVLNTVYNLDWEPMSFHEFVTRQKEIQKEYPYLVSEVDGQIIGYACAHRAFEKASYQFDADLTIYFRPGPHYGQVGEIMDRLEDILYRQNIHWLIGCISKSNQTSIAFHERRGFVFKGELDHAGFKNNAWHNVVWYGKELKKAEDYIHQDLRFVPISHLEEVL